MCEISDLVVMVVESDEKTLESSCNSLEKLGIARDKILCVHTYESAVEALTANSDIDIVLSDFNIENEQDLGLLLCTTLKRRYPKIFFILTSKEYSCSIVLESIKNGVDDILDLNRENEIEKLMKKWVLLAQYRNIAKEILYGRAQRPGP